MNLDMTYCYSKLCEKSDKCKRALHHHSKDITPEANISTMSGEECILNWHVRFLEIGKIKLGDWVKHIFNPLVIVQVRTNPQNGLFVSDWSNFSYIGDFKLWTPEHREWVVLVPQYSPLEEFKIIRYDASDPIECMPLVSLNQLIKEFEHEL